MPIKLRCKVIYSHLKRHRESMRYDVINRRLFYQQRIKYHQQVNSSLELSNLQYIITADV